MIKKEQGIWDKKRCKRGPCFNSNFIAIVLGQGWFDL